MDIRKTKAWKTAKLEYQALYAESMVPIFGSPSPEDKIKQFEMILKECPQFYPALLDMSMHKMAQGGSQRAENQFKQGFKLMLSVCEPAEIEESVDILTDNLEQIWRFDLIQHCLVTLLPEYPEKASFYDSLAHAAAMLGEIEKAVAYIQKAVELAPKNHHFVSNHGWIHLIKGDLKTAKASLEAALRLEPDDEIVTNNLKIQKYLTKHGGNYFDYLIRPVNRAKIEKYETEEKWEEVDRLIADYNNDRFNAMAQYVVKEKKDKLPQLYDNISTLIAFFRFVRNIDQDTHFNEDIDFIEDYFKPIMHKFIFKHGDVDRKMIEEIYSALLQYYQFLSSQGLIPVSEFNQFRKTILGMRKELIEKMHKYNAIRHRHDVDESEKEAVRETLFEGDHDWPFL